MKKVNIILLIIWMIIIFVFSSDTGEESSSKSDPLAHSIVSTISDITDIDYDKLYEKIDVIITIVRKSAHFIVYFILGILVIRVLKDYNTMSNKLCIIGIIICMLYATSDEVHQIFVSGRSGEVRDVLLDTSASCISICFYYWLYRKKNRNK